jgi:exonuclease SbcC
MIIDRIILKNFKRFRYQEIRFKDGITGILGNNGTGKSTIVEAIFFALYGVQATGISSDYIVSSFAGPKDKAEVRLDFRIGGDEYTVHRTFRKGKTIQHDADFHKEGKLRATGVSQVEAEMRRTLGTGPVDFRNTIYAAQKDLLTLLEHTPGKRKEWFLRALGIDYLKTESDRLLKERIDAKDREIQLLEGELKGLIDRYEPGELSELQKLVEQLDITRKDLEDHMVSRTERRKEVAAELHRFQEKKTDYTRLVERHTALSGDKKDLVRQREMLSDQLKSLPGLEKESQDLEKEVSALDAKKQSLEGMRNKKSEYERLKSEIRFTEKEWKEFDTRVGKTRANIEILDKDAERLASLRKGVRGLLRIGQQVPDTDLEQAAQAMEADLLHTIGTLSARLEHLVEERKNLAADWKIIEEAGPHGICPLCRQTLGAHYGQIEGEFSSRFDRIEKEALETCEQKDREIVEKDRIDQQKPAFREIRSISERLKNRSQLGQDLQELLAALRRNEEERKSLANRISESGYDETAFLRAEREVKDLERVQDRCIELGKQIAHGKAQMSQLEELGARIQKKEEEIVQIKAAIENSDFNPELGTRLELALEGIDSEIHAAGAEIAANNERVKGAKEKIERYKKDEKAIEELKSRKEGLEEDTGLLRLTRSLIGEYVLYLMQVVRSRIEGEVSQIISEITGGRYEQVLLDEDFNLLVRDIDDDFPIDRFSGGEQDDIAVALRIALSRYLAELHNVHESTLLIFDEIFGSQDEERRTNLLSALRTQESRFPQIILISHIPDIHGEFSNTLMVEMGADQSSRVQELT